MRGSIASATEPIELLLVDDDPSDARFTKEAFETVETDVTVHVIGNGAKAFDALTGRVNAQSQSVPDLVLLALDLPQMNGFELLDAIRANAALQRLPVLVVADSTATDDVRESYQKHANAYLSKPTEPEAFVAIARAVERFWFHQVSLPSR